MFFASIIEIFIYFTPLLFILYIYYIRFLGKSQILLILNKIDILSNNEILKIKEVRFGRVIFTKQAAGKQSVSVLFGTPMAHAPNVIMLTWNDTVNTPGSMQELDWNQSTVNGFACHSKRINTTDDWYAQYLALYIDT